MPIYIYKTVNSGGTPIEGNNIYKITNFTELSVDQQTFAENIGDIAGNENTSIQVKTQGSVMLINVGYTIMDESSSVVSGVADPASVATAIDQFSYLFSTLKSFGSVQILDQYRISIEFASATVTGTATGGSATTLVDAGKSWTTDQYKGYIVKITGGTAAGSVRQITSNTATTLTVSDSSDDTSIEHFTTNPDATSQYSIIQGLERPGTPTKITPVMTSDQPLTFKCNIQFQVGTVL